MTGDHKARTHSVWSASATSRNWTCSGALAMAALAGPEKESKNAARGTATHETAEMALMSQQNCVAYISHTVRTEAFEIEVDEEIADTAQTHVDYVRTLTPPKFYDGRVEERLNLDRLKPPFEAGGTADYIAIGREEIEVVDLKTGVRVVEVNENKQTRSYALMALLSLSPKEAATIKRVKSTIVQPRAPHHDGIIRSETIHVADLLDWSVDLVAAMHRSKAALDAFDALPEGNRVAFEDWAEEWLTVGACTFCPAQAICPKFRKAALSVADDAVRKWFDRETDEMPNLSNAPNLLSPEELSRTLDGLDMLEDWIGAIRNRAHNQAEIGVVIPNYILVDKIGRRAWMEKDEIAVAAKLCAELNIGDKDVFTRDLRSVAQIEKTLGTKRKDELAKLEGVLWHKPKTGLNLVRENKTSRQPAQSKAAAWFEEVAK